MRTLRVGRGLSQEALGLRAGVSRAFFGKVERGDANPTFETIVKVAAGLELPAADVVALAERYLADDAPARPGTRSRAAGARR